MSKQKQFEAILNSLNMSYRSTLEYTHNEVVQAMQKAYDLDREKCYAFADLVKAANMGSDFQAANASTIKFDTLEDMLNEPFTNHTN